MCDENTAHFRRLFREANLSESRFVRTTDDTHKQSVHAMWNKLSLGGHIIKGSHSGYYSTNEETFFPEKDLEKNESGQMTVPGTGEICDYVTEENYVFKLSEEE